MQHCIPKRELYVVRLDLSQDLRRKNKDQDRNFQRRRELNLQVDLYQAGDEQQDQR